MANSMDPDQTALIGAVCFGSIMFASILNLSVMFSDLFTNLGLWFQGLDFSHINESNCNFMSPEHHIFTTSLQYHCILGLAEIKTLHLTDKIMSKRCRMCR